MIIKNIYHKIEIHPFFYITAFFMLITGNFRPFCLFTSILFVHEMGHILMGLYYHWNIKSIHIYPFGALTEFKEHLNKPIKEEFWITFMGPCFQIIFYYFLSNMMDSSLLYSFHYGLLLFNLLPIIPLDGSKFVLLFFQTYLSYWKSNLLISLISMITISIVCLYFLSNSYIYILIFLILLDKSKEFYSKRYAVFSKFLLERRLYNFIFPKRKIIKGNDIKKMKRDTKHIFYIGKKYHTEQEILKKRLT